MSNTVSENETTFPPDYWQRQSYYRLDAQGRAEVDVKDALNRLSETRKVAIRKEMTEAPISIHPDWLSFLWREIQAYGEMTPKNKEDAAELEVELTRLVLKAIAEERVTNPAQLAKIIQSFRIPEQEW